MVRLISACWQRAWFTIQERSNIDSISASVSGPRLKRPQGAIHNQTEPTEEEETMRIQLLMKQVVLMGCLVVASAVLPTVQGQAADPPAKESTASLSTREMNVMASGSVEDTLKLCLARIPKDASAGQRLLAEQSCQGAERTRSTSQGASQY